MKKAIYLGITMLSAMVLVGCSNTSSAPTQSNSQPMSNATNMDILKRLSNLERHVFGAQLNDDVNRGNRF